MERTDQPDEQHTPPPPRASEIISQPATVDACRADYQAGADVRSRMDAQLKGLR